jgi:hypothetical protein
LIAPLQLICAYLAQISTEAYAGDLQVGEALGDQRFIQQ